MRTRARAPLAQPVTAIHRFAVSLTVLAVLAVLLLAACAQPSAIAGKKTTPTATTSRAARDSTPSASASPGATPQATPANSPFVCANPAGSSLTYAFVNADRQIYMVSGCSAPKQLTHLQFTDTYTIPIPVAWSPSHRYLAIHPNTQQDYCLKILDTSTGDILNTQYDCFNGDPSATGDARSFIGWLDDNTFLGRVDVGVAYAPNPTRIVRVDIHSQAETTVANFDWMSDQKLRGAYLFFGGRVNPSDTTAYLYRLSLADGSSAKLVSLGLSGQGGCQVSLGPCNWTAPWDVSPDGAHVLYHNPGASSFPSDTSGPADTPVYYANVDGSGATRVLSGQWSSLIGPVFDPTGARATTFVPGSNYNNDFLYQALPGNGFQRLAGVNSVEWRSDGQAAVITNLTYNGNVTNSTVTLIAPDTQARSSLAPNTYFYLWAS